MKASRHACALAAGLAAAALWVVAPAAAPRPPHLRPPDPASDEAGLWYAADKAEQGARASGDLDTDPTLFAYVKQVECKVAPEYCDELRLYVMDRPLFNASTAPNGYMEVWSGLLLRARDEAELAFVLGHETTHYALNHSIEARRDFKRNMGAVLPLAVLSAPFAGALVLDLAYLGAALNYAHFSREQELQADQGGLDRMAAAGYDPNAASAIFQERIDEQGASTFEKIRREPAHGGIFDDHPLDKLRLGALSEAGKGKPSGDRGRERYRSFIHPYLAQFIRDDLRRRDFGETLFIIDRLKADGGDEGVLNYFRGECFRLRRGDGDAANAVKAYEDAVVTPDAPAAAWRELGGLYQQQHQPDKARAAYLAYLDHAPTAQDRWLVESALKTLEHTESS
jgi:hypothetical protein